MDLTKIKEAAAREKVRSEGAHPMAYALAEKEDRLLLVRAAPALLAEIERLKKLALEGWVSARDMAEGEGVEPVERVAAAIKEIEATS